MIIIPTLHWDSCMHKSGMINYTANIFEEISLKECTNETCGSRC